MKNNNLNAILTAGVLVALMVFALGRQANWNWHTNIASILNSPAPQTPEDGIYKMLDAARAGNTAAYLDSFSGDMHTQIAEVINETSEAKFRQYLLNQNHAFTGVAVSIKDKPDSGNARVRVEYVFPERNEVQEMYVRKEGASWKIFKVIGSEQITTLIPYGTAVTD